MEFEDWFVSRARVSSKRHARVTTDDRVALFQQLATLISSGTPLLESIQVCAQQSESTKLQETLDEIAERISSGSPLHAAMAEYPNVFETHWVNVIQTGEAAGKIGLVLHELNQKIREQREARRQLMGALAYPIILSIVSVIAITVLLSFVVPTFASMFAEMGSELPQLTQFVVNLSDFVVHYGIFVAAGLFGLGLGFRQYLKTELGRRRTTAVALSVPLLGELLVYSAMYRFASGLALLLKSGVPMLEALNTLAGVFHLSPIYRDAVVHAQEKVAAGAPLADSLQDTNLFTNMMTSMVHVGEESATLAGVMEQTAPYYKERMQNIVTKLTKLMEPTIIVIMGAAIAVVMMSIYLPMFEMAGHVK